MIDYLYHHCKAIEEAEDQADRELEEEINDARELTIKDYKKDFGYGRYNVRGGGESIYEGNSLKEAIEAIADHFAALPNNHVHPVFKDILNALTERECSGICPQKRVERGTDRRCPAEYFDEPKMPWERRVRHATGKLPAQTG